MRVVIAGGHGKIGLRLGRLLADRGDEAIGVVRNPDHAPDLESAGVSPYVLDLEHASVADASKALAGADAVVFTAGAGPGSGAARKDTVDRAAAVLVADAAERIGTARYLQVSAMGVESVRGGATPPGTDAVFAAYLAAKLAAEDDLRRRSLDWTILRPGGLTDQPGTGRVHLAPRVERGKVSRDDVAATLLTLLDAPETAGLVLELVGGETPVTEAVAGLSSPR
jgi:uncharacterized protein YbjT (DUF2867 family)